MWALVVGLGSMGRRRVRDLVAARRGAVGGVDAREDRREQAAAAYGIQTFASFDEALKRRPSIVVISTPPDRHLDLARLATESGAHVFIELNIVDEDLAALDALSRQKGVVVAPSATMRFHDSITRLRATVASGALGRPCSYTHSYSHWLPLWHPWEDYRTFFASKRATGACREIAPLELNWLAEIFGPVTSVCGFARKLSKLDSDIDDCYHGLFEHASGVVGHLEIDVIGKLRRRAFRLVAEEGIVEWTMGEAVRIYHASERRWDEYPESTDAYETMYKTELSAFLEATEGKRDWPHPLGRDSELVSLVRAWEASDREGQAQRRAAGWGGAH